MLLAGVLLKMGTYGLIRIAVPVLPDGLRAIAPVLGAFGVAGILWGGLACLVERDLKRLVAFSSVAHMGFILLGIASMTPEGLQGALFANIAHGLITGLLFFVAGGIKDRHHSSDLSVLGSGFRDRLPADGLDARLRRDRRARPARAGRVLGRVAGHPRRLAATDALGALARPAGRARRARHGDRGRLPAAGAAADLARAARGALADRGRTRSPTDATGLEVTVAAPLVLTVAGRAAALDSAGRDRTRGAPPGGRRRWRGVTP